MGDSRKISGWLIGAVIAATLIVGATVGVLYAMGAGPFKGADAEQAQEAQSDLARFARGSLAALETPAALEVAPDYVFKDRDGADVRFSDFRGRVVVVNLWAMWCAPCRTEMPTLANLQTAYPIEDLLVLPVNVDDSADEIAEATSFIDVHEPLPMYSDPSFQLPFEFPGKGKMPQTIVLDREGRVRAWFAGEADWHSPEARALMDALLAES